MNDRLPPEGDTRDTRTGEGLIPQGDFEGPPVTSSEGMNDFDLIDIQDPVDAANPLADPSDFSIDEINMGETPLDEGMDRLIDPSIGRERMSNNMDVLDLDSSLLVRGEEPDFMEEPGTTDLVEVIEDGEPYFPPTDPPLGSRLFTNAEVLDGFAESSLEEPTKVEDEPLRVQGNDEDLAEQVRRALALDSYTSDLNIEVEVEYGVVYLHGRVTSLDDIEQAEQI